ncbi:MAG: TonB-dependent receptor [Deltaproteobacteria bacterium]|nr:TonB-dependent receptor [Deltaproteobacteria bacterium]
MSKWKEIMLAFVLVWTFCIPSAFAEEKKSGEPLKLEPVEVVASPISEGNLVTDYASQVTTVTEKQVESLNAKLTFRLTPKGAAMPSHLFLAGENLTDQRYEYLKGYPAPGITIMGGANVAF